MSWNQNGKNYFGKTESFSTSNYVRLGFSNLLVLTYLIFVLRTRVTYSNLVLRTYFLVICFEMNDNIISDFNTASHQPIWF